MTSRGTAELINEDVIPFSSRPTGSTQPLRVCTEEALRKYFHDLDGDMPSELYAMVLGEIEPPLLKTVLEYTRGNQSRAAEILGLNRSTLRKKLRQYGINP